METYLNDKYFREVSQFMEHLIGLWLK